jgi:hypothetical protein
MRYYGKNIRHLEFVVVKHKLKGLETEILGVKYREGYAVVAKDTKTYQQLKKIRNAIDAEYPITHLENLSCVINDKQVRYIWGQAVFDYYIKKKHEVENMTDLQKGFSEAPECTHIKEDETKCLAKAMKNADYCIHHIKFDERVREDFESLPMMPKAEKKKLIKKIIKEKIKES